jgi:hypothetical protein
MEGVCKTQTSIFDICPTQVSLAKNTLVFSLFQQYCIGPILVSILKKGRLKKMSYS